MVSLNGSNGPDRRVTGKALFRIGVVVSTPGAVDVMREHNVHPLILIAMHASGIWGDIDPKDRGLNEAAIPHKDRIMSVYKFGGETLWVITDPGHETTTILTPDEY